jgi:hypothetical protein
VKNVEKKQKFLFKMNKLPTLKEIIDGQVTVDEKYRGINVLLNQPPPAQWIRKNTFAGNSEYLPIDKIEYLLTSIYNDWFIKIKNVQLIGNSVEVTLTLFVKPIIDELQNEINNSEGQERIDLLKIKYTRKREDWYLCQDGTGAAAIQVDAGEKASAFDKIKAYGVAIASPKAESIAISDAADKLGRIFGKDLNRSGLVDYGKVENMEKFKGAKITEK